MTTIQRARRAAVWTTAAAATLLLLGWADVSAAEEPALLTVVEGVVEVGVGDPPRFEAAQPGAELPPGAVLRTGPDSRAEVQRGGDTLRLYADTLLRLGSDGDETHVELERGRSLFDVLRGRDRGFRVRTRQVAVQVKGTRFLVDAEDSFVTVFRGVVGVEDLLQAAEAIDVRSGLSLSRFESRGSLELRVTPFSDPWKAWSTGGAHPLLDLPKRQNLSFEAEREVREALGGQKERPDGSAPPEQATPEPSAPAKAAAEPKRDTRGKRAVLAEDGFASQALPAGKLDPVLDVPRQLDPGTVRRNPRGRPGGPGPAKIASPKVLPVPGPNGKPLPTKPNGSLEDIVQEMGIRLGQEGQTIGK